MTSSVTEEFEALAYLELCALTYPQAFKQAVLTAERNLIVRIEAAGGRVYEGGLTLRVEVVHMEGRMIGKYLIARGVMPVIPAHIPVPNSVSWRRGVSLNLLQQAGSHAPPLV